MQEDWSTMEKIQRRTVYRIGNHFLGCFVFDYERNGYMQREFGIQLLLMTFMFRIRTGKRGPR